MGDVLRSFELTDNDRNLLSRIEQGLPVIADLVRADLLVYVATRTADTAELVFEARPRYISLLRSTSPSSRNVTSRDDPDLMRVLNGGKAPRPARTPWGSQASRSLHPIKHGPRTIGVISVDFHLADRVRRNRDPILGHALGQLWRMVLTGQLDGSKNISALGEHDGPLVVDNDGRILYTSGIAESLYRKLGYSKPLVGSKITELGTDEPAFIRAIETGMCFEQTVQEGGLVITKKAIPLSVTRRNSWQQRLLRKPEDFDGALLVLHDITEERRREQELKIKATMIQEIHHRVKNNLQTIAALLRLQARRTGSEEVAEMLRQTINRILSVAVVHEFLSHDESSVINVKEICQRIIDEVTQAVVDPEKQIRFVLDGGNVHLPAQQATACALVVNELLQNAVEHGFVNRWSGTVTINLLDDGNYLRVEIIDDGQGLPPGFSVSRGCNLGLQIVNSLVKEDLRGEFELIGCAGGGDSSTKGGGARAIVTIPKSQRSQKMIVGVGI